MLLVEFAQLQIKTGHDKLLLILISVAADSYTTFLPLFQWSSTWSGHFSTQRSEDQRAEIANNWASLLWHENLQL